MQYAIDYMNIPFTFIHMKSYIISKQFEQLSNQKPGYK